LSIQSLDHSAQHGIPPVKVRLFIVLALLSGCPADMLNDAIFLEEMLRAAVSKAKLTLLGVSVKKFFPQGVTGVALLGESHAAIHTWPEHGRIFMDIATCSTKECADSVFQSICAAFPGARIDSFQESVVGNERVLF
jgi:S-adenosylmethionine decarboxylase